MRLLFYEDTPFDIHLSFAPLMAKLEKQAAGTGDEATRAQTLLREAAPYPELITGITDSAHVAKHEALIGRLLADYFPADLTNNEIKAVSLPYTGILFNHTQRFRNILQAAGAGFEFNFRDLDEHQSYVISCCIIMNEYFGTDLDFFKPLFCDIPTANGIIRHYRILYNADFLEIRPTEAAVLLTPEDIKLLRNNYNDLALWKEKFPPESWILKGFAIMNLYDATVENAVSLLKEKLLALNVSRFHDSIESIFRSIYRIPDLRIGFSVYDHEEGRFGMDNFGPQLHSFMLQEDPSLDARNLLCSRSYSNIIEDKTYFAVDDTAAYLADCPESKLGRRLLLQRIQSFIIAPIVKNNQLLGVLEVVSARTGELNSINANKLEVVMPFLTDSVERLTAQAQNQIQAIIQEQYTSIHPSVYWKFRDEAKRFMGAQNAEKTYNLQEIVFHDVYPLYGQIDIKGSSEARNTSIQKDLQAQLTALLSLIEVVNTQESNNFFFEEIQQVTDYLEGLSMPLRASTEQYLINYLDKTVHPRLRQVTNLDLLPVIHQYFSETLKHTGGFHTHRRKYETTITVINETMSGILDKKQVEAQQAFPHYYERFKTDGVEHNLYIGSSIAPKLEFDLQKLYDLRLWQLQTLCKMEVAHHRIKPALPYPLGVTTLVLVYHSTISIRFRMDEKRFDVDGSYNARFEIVKKRIDKANIKDTTNRITEEGKITIVYSNEPEEQEYLQYIRTLQSQHLLEDNIEMFEVEDLQGVSGLKALRVKIIHKEQ